MGALKYLLFFGMISIANNSYAQLPNAKQIDSLIKVADRIDDVDKSIPLGIEAANYAKRIGYDKGIILGLTLAAAKSYNAARYGDVLKYSDEANNSVDSIRDPSLKVHLILLKGMSLTNLGLYQQAKDLLKTALPIALTITNPNRRHYRLSYVYNALSDNIEQSKGDPKISLQLMRQSYNEQMKISDTSSFANGKALATNNLALNYLRTNQNDSAEFYLRKSVLLALQYNDITVKVFANADLGDLYFKKKRYADAEEFYNKSFSAAKVLKNQYELKRLYIGLSKVYSALKDTPKSEKFLRQAMNLTDSLNEVEKSSIQTPINAIVKNKDAEISSSSRTNKHLAMFLVAVLMLLIGVFSVLFVFSRKSKKQLKVSDEKVAELTKKIKSDKPQYTVNHLKEIVELAINYNPLFMAKFNEVYPDFTEKLLVIAPSLIASEMEVCILLRINFDTKEIARYTKSSIRSIEGKKRRIRKKLNVDSKIDLNLWMASV